MRERERRRAPAEPSEEDSGFAFDFAGKTGLFVTVVGGILAADQATKLLVQSRLRRYEQVEVIGDFVRLTLIYNPGAAFGIHFGPYSRHIFLALSAIVTVALVGMYWVTPADDRSRLSAIALVVGGALGNIIDRIRSARGVIDFVDIGFGTLRWPVFNIADIAITIGAILLAISLWNEDVDEQRR